MGLLCSYMLYFLARFGNTYESKCTMWFLTLQIQKDTTLTHIKNTSLTTTSSVPLQSGYTAQNFCKCSCRYLNFSALNFFVECGLCVIVERGRVDGQCGEVWPPDICLTGSPVAQGAVVCQTMELNVEQLSTNKPHFHRCVQMRETDIIMMTLLLNHLFVSLCICFHSELNWESFLNYSSGLEFELNKSTNQPTNQPSNQPSNHPSETCFHKRKTSNNQTF